MSGLVAISRPPLLVRILKPRQGQPLWSVVGYAWTDETWFPRFEEQHHDLPDAIQNFRYLLRSSHSFHGPTSRHTRRV